jgi:hypothetical protein
VPKRPDKRETITLKASAAAIGQLIEEFIQDPDAFFREAELHSRLSTLLLGSPDLATEKPRGPTSIVHQEYPTPFKCQMGDLRFEVLEDEAKARRGHYDLTVLNPWWVDKASPEALRNDDFALFRKEIRDQAQPDDPPLCLVGVEVHLVKTGRPRLADYGRIGQDYRKLLLSGALANGWRFMDHRYMLVYSQHSQPHEAKWRELVQAAWEPDVDPRDVRLAWTSPQGTRWSG